MMSLKVTSVCKRSRPLYPEPVAPIDSKSGVSAPHLPSGARRLSARPSRGTYP